MKVNLTTEQQSKIIQHIQTTQFEYETKMKSYLADKAEEYEEYTSFKLSKKNAWDTDTKVNKAYEAVEKRAGKLTSREPVWITSVRPDIEYKLYQESGENLQSNVDKIKDITNHRVIVIRHLEEMRHHRVGRKDGKRLCIIVSCGC